MSRIIHRQDQRDWGSPARDWGYLIPDGERTPETCSYRTSDDECRGGGHCDRLHLKCIVVSDVRADEEKEELC